MNQGDAILKNDTKYMVPAEGKQGQGLYIAYPSAEVPRFLIPTADATAQKFILHMMSANTGYIGKLVRVLLKIPGGVFLLKLVVFRSRVRIPYDQ